MLLKIKPDTHEWWMLMNAMGEDYEKVSKIIKNSPTKEKGSYEFDIELKVNGIELNFNEVIKDVFSHIDDYIESKAKNLLKDKCESLIESFKEECDELTDNFCDSLYK